MTILDLVIFFAYNRKSLTILINLFSKTQIAVPKGRSVSLTSSGNRLQMRPIQKKSSDLSANIEKRVKRIAKTLVGPANIIDNTLNENPNLPSNESGATTLDSINIGLSVNNNSLNENTEKSKNVETNERKSDTITMESLIKAELRQARETISMLNSQMGTTIIKSSSNSENDNLSDDGEVSIQIEQRDGLFGKKFIFRTNVSKFGDEHSNSIFVTLTCFRKYQFNI